MTGHDLLVLSIPIATSLAACIVLVVDLLLPAERRHWTGGIAALLMALVFGLTFVTSDSGSTLSGGIYVANAATLFIQRLSLAASVFGILGGLAHVSHLTRLRQGEYYFLLLSSVIGMTLLPGARDLILLLIAFELMGLPLYALAAFEKPEGPQGATARGRAAEAGLKLYLVGAASTAVTLFGLSIVAGLSGGTSFAAIAAGPRTPLFVMGGLMILAGLAFKLGAAPFHMWLPDTYEAAPGPFVAFLSGAPKAAAVTALCGLFLSGLGHRTSEWAPAVAALAALTIVTGSLLALPQTRLRRLLAYSGVAHAGYILLALSTGSAEGAAMILFYLVAYVATNTGVFLIAHAMAANGDGEDVEGLSGIAQRSPALGFALMIFLLSLAGIPFVAGFWAKLYVFIAAWNAGMHWLVAAGALLSVVALFFYMRLARAAYMAEPRNAEPIRIARPLQVAIAGCLVAVLVIGVWPSPLLEASSRAAASLFASAPAVALGP
jgi:NADH-quinone oxidoreductase subunit N